jgi:hypothetical protein
MNELDWIVCRGKLTGRGKQKKLTVVFGLMGKEK